jgi:hypothetical protein
MDSIFYDDIMPVDEAIDPDKGFNSRAYADWIDEQTAYDDEDEISNGYEIINPR